MTFRQSWRNQALCNGLPSDLFFLSAGQSPETAKRICSACPVQLECLEYALERHEITDGIYGGYTAPERRQIRKNRKEGTA